MTNQASATSDPVFRKTRFALFWTGLLNEPLVGLFALMPFILRKDLKATLLQISIFTMLKPAVTVFSFYWSSRLRSHGRSLRANLLGAWILGRVLFLFFPWVENSWFAILASMVYLIFYRAATPAQMEILKQNLPSNSQGRLFSLSSALNYAEGVIIGILLGFFLDAKDWSWQILFCLSSLLGMSSIAIQWRVPIQERAKSPDQKEKASLIKPWKDCWKLLRENPEFAHFQWGFMAGGIGLMLMAPALTLYYADILCLSHTDMTISRFICMGLGFVFTSALWSKSLSRVSSNRLTSLVCLGFAAFPLSLLFAQFHVMWVYLAFLIYGIAQAGSHLIWHLSGPLFAAEKESSLFSTVNVLMVGLRGLIAPLVGCLLCKLASPQIVLGIGMGFCLYGAIYLKWKKVTSRNPCLEKAPSLK